MISEKCLLFLGEDRIKLINEIYNEWKEVKTSTQIKEMLIFKFLSGHDSQNVNDYDAIAYFVINIILVKKKKWKDLSLSEFCSTVDLMKKYGYKVSKSALKRYKRLRKKLEEDRWEFAYYNSIIENEYEALLLDKK